MIAGIGTDICDLRRIEQAQARWGERFARRVLGPSEIEVYRARSARSAKRGTAYLGTRFSVKEAFSKAIGLGMRQPMQWRDCETLNAPGGRPAIRLHGALRAWFESRAYTAHVTLSDEGDYSVAFVVVERGDPA